MIRVATRVMRGLLEAIGLMLLVALAVVTAALLNLDTPVVRRLAAERVNTLVFAPLFRGKLTIVSLGHVDPFGVSGVTVRVEDPSGQQVLAADGVAARIATWSLVRSLLFGHGDVQIALSNVQIKHADVRLDQGPDGLALAQAFDIRPSSTPAPPSDGPGILVRLHAPTIHVDHAWGHGHLDGLPYIDGEVSDVGASFSLDGTCVELDATRGRVIARGIALGANAEGAFDGRLTLGPGSPLAGRFGWDGTIGAVRETASGGLENGRVDATVDAPAASALAIQSLWPGSPIVGTATAHVEAHGPTNAVDVAIHAGLDSATADIKGVVSLGDTLTAKLHVVVHEVDLHQIVPALDPSNLSLTSDVEAAFTSAGRLEGKTTLDLATGHFGKNRIPATTLEGHGFRDRSGAFGGDASIVIDEPGAPTKVTLHAEPTAQSSNIEFAIVSHEVRIGALRRFSTDATGSAHVLGKGNIDLENLKVDVALDSLGHGFSHGELSIGGLAVAGKAKGNLLNPDVDLHVHATGIGWGNRHVNELSVGIRGKALSPHVTVVERSSDLPNVDGLADVDVLHGPTVRAASLHLSRAGEAVDVRVEQVRVGDGAVVVDGALVDGLGAPITASGSRSRDSVRLRVHAPRIELGRVAKLLGIDVVRAGTLELDGDVTGHGGAIDGHAKLALEHAAVGPFVEISAHADGTVKGRHFAGTAGARVASLGWIDVDAKTFDIGGAGPLTLGSLRSAWGDVRLSGQVDLAAIAGQLPADLPVTDIRGRLDIKGRFERDSRADVTPLVELQVDTLGLALRGAASTWSLAGVDAGATVRVNGDTGFLELAARLHDATGDLVSVAATSGEVPFADLYGAPARALAKLPRMPFEARLTVPRRAVASWPPALRRVPMDGELEAQGFITGPLQTPHIVLNGKLSSMKNAATRFSSPLDVALRAVYDTGHADAELHVSAEGHEVLSSDAHALVAANDLLFGTSPPPWKASGKVHVEQLPLVTIGALDDRQVRGRLSGDVVLTDLHANAKAHASLTVESLKIGDAVYPTAKASLDADGKMATVDVRVDESDGFGSLHASVPAAWGALLVPQPDPKRALDVTFLAKSFRAAVLLPFVRGSLDQLDGLVDADVRATLDPTTAAIRAHGSVGVRDGVLQITDLGGELHGVDAKATLTEEGLLTLERFVASGVSGEVQASASARLDGLNLVAASAVVQIPKSLPLPVSVGGALLGTLDGRINLTESLSADRKVIELKADIPTLHLVAPEQGSQDVQVLGPMARVKTGTHSGPERTFVLEKPDPVEESDSPDGARRSGGVEVHVITKFGDDVSVRKGTDVHMELAGGPTITVTDKVVVAGQVRLRAGALNLYGKAFEIEQGTVSFVGVDPSNPQVSVTAGWVASDGTQVKADFIGPLKTGKVTLRSEPSLPTNDILHLLLFGSNDDATVASQGGVPGASAEGVAGNLATQPLNRVFSQFGLSAISAKVDTSSVNAKPEVEVQIAKDISVAVAQIIGQPPVGSSPDTSFLSVDWHFLRKWSVTATVGNAGTTVVDLLWKYRY